MTATTSSPATSGDAGQVVPRPDLVTITVDGFEVSVPKGTLVIRAAEQLGVQIPRFCDHPLLDPAGACRQCLVEIGMPGRDDPSVVQWMPKPQASCTITVAPGMHVRTQHSSSVADKAQQGIMEFLLMNHPLDCPVCDKGGECPLQNQAMSNGRSESRFDGPKRTYPKPVSISAQVLLDRERCVLCARCTRFSQEIAGDPFIELLERGSLQQVGIYEKEPFESYFSGNTIQICPVGALTSQAYRFRARPFDLVSVKTACEQCASGCSLRTDYRRSKVMRRLAWNDPEVNEEWNCDKGRFAFRSTYVGDRITNPLVRDAETGELETASWSEALAAAAAGLTAARDNGGVGVLTGGRLSVEDAYAYAKFARVVLNTNDIDFRARVHSAEETDFLGATVAGAGLGVTYADLEAAPAVLLVGLEPEEESPMVFLRLRKAVRKRGLAVHSIAAFESRGLAKLTGTLIPAAPGTEAEVLAGISAGHSEVAGTTTALTQAGSVILVGERLAATVGGFTAVSVLAAATGARLAWVPRRAGERGALDAGAFPTVLPGGHPVSDAAARADVGAVWGVASLPSEPGKSAADILTAAGAGELAGLVVGGVELNDFVDPRAARAAVESAGFVVSLEVRASEVSALADVVLPVAAVTEKSGTFLNWEGRQRPFDQVLDGTNAMSEARVLSSLAAELDVQLGLGTSAAAATELAELAQWDGARVVAAEVAAEPAVAPSSGHAVLASWRMLLDDGRQQDGETHLAATSRAPIARLSATTAAEAGVVDGAALTLSSDSGGSITLPLVVTEMPDHVVWVPQASVGSHVHRDLGVGVGAVVLLSQATPRAAEVTDNSDEGSVA